MLIIVIRVWLELLLEEKAVIPAGVRAPEKFTLSIMRSQFFLLLLLGSCQGEVEVSTER